MADAPEGLLYTPRHMWVKLEQDNQTADVGVTEELIRRLTTVISVDHPLPGQELVIDTDCLHLHLSTGIKPLYAPLTGRIVEGYNEVLDQPELIHIAPYENPLFQMEYDEEGELDLLLSPVKYAIYLDEY